MKLINAVSVAIGDGVVTLKREGSSATTVASVLGKVLRDGVELVCLDRLVHEPFENQFGEWQVSGAVTTMLTRAVSDSASA